MKISERAYLNYMKSIYKVCNLNKCIIWEEWRKQSAFNIPVNQYIFSTHILPYENKCYTMPLENYTLFLIIE